MEIEDRPTAGRGPVPVEPWRLRPGPVPSTGPLTATARAASRAAAARPAPAIAASPTRDSGVHSPALIGYSCFEHEATAATRPVFHRGNGPVVVLLHELAGMTPQCLDLADRLVARELHVVLPLLFGRPAHRLSRWRRSTVCLSREVDGLALGRSSPLTGWLCSLVRRVSRDLHGDRPVGLVGLGASGSFVLSLVADGMIEAAVLAHPTLPVGPSAAARRDLKISAGELAAARQQVEQRHLQLLGLRFSADRKSPPDRFRALAATFGSSFREIEIDSAAGNLNGIRGRAHALLTDDYRDEPGHPTKLAFERVAAFLRLRLCTQ